MKVKENMALYIRYASVCTQSIMEYKLSFLLMVFARFMMAFGELTAIKFFICRHYTDKRVYLWRYPAVFFHCTNVLYFCGVVRQWVQGIFRNGARGRI